MAEDNKFGKNMEKPGKCVKPHGCPEGHGAPGETNVIPPTPAPKKKKTTERSN